MCRIAVQAPVVPATSGPARSKEKRSAWLCPRNSMNGCGRLLLSGANSRPRSRKCNVSAAKFCLKPCPTLHAVNDWARKFLVLCKRHSPEGVEAPPSLGTNSGCNPLGLIRVGTFSQGSSFLATLARAGIPLGFALLRPQFTDAYKEQRLADAFVGS